MSESLELFDSCHEASLPIQVLFRNDLEVAQVATVKMITLPDWCVFPKSDVCDSTWNQTKAGLLGGAASLGQSSGISRVFPPKSEHGIGLLFP